MLGPRGDGQLVAVKSVGGVDRRSVGVGVGNGSGKCDRPRESKRDTFLREVKEKYQKREDLGKKAQFSLLLFGLSPIRRKICSQ